MVLKVTKEAHAPPKAKAKAKALKAKKAVLKGIHTSVRRLVWAGKPQLGNAAWGSQAQEVRNHEGR